MGDDRTTAVVKAYLVAWRETRRPTRLSGSCWTGPSGRLRLLCAGLLLRGYPRLTRPPLNLEVDDLLGAVVGRVLRGMSQGGPGESAKFLPWPAGTAGGSSMTWPAALPIGRRSAGSTRPRAGRAEQRLGLGPDGRRILEAIDDLPDDEREVFGLVRIQGLTHAEAAGVLGVSVKTVQRRLKRGLLLLSRELEDLGPGREAATPLA